MAKSDVHENQLDDHDRDPSSTGSQPGDRDHVRGVMKGMFRGRDCEPVNYFATRCRELWGICGDPS